MKPVNENRSRAPVSVDRMDLILPLHVLLLPQYRICHLNFIQATPTYVPDLLDHSTYTLPTQNGRRVNGRQEHEKVWGAGDMGGWTCRSCRCTPKEHAQGLAEGDVADVGEGCDHQPLLHA